MSTTTTQLTARDLNSRTHTLAQSILAERIRFTGWKDSDVAEGYVGQWIAYCPNERYYFVNLPNMAHGRFKKGDEFPIGSERVQPYDNVTDLLQRGLDKLLEIIGT